MRSSAALSALSGAVLSTVIVAAAVVAAVVVGPAPASAATGPCTAYGSLPHRVALHQDRTVVTSVLRGSPGCYNRATDNGATATLWVPGGNRNDTHPMRWSRFGTGQSVQLYVNLDRSGTYTMAGGNVQLYDEHYERVQWSWSRTSMIVKRAARIVDVSAGNGVVSGRALAYRKYGWTGYRDKTVYVQRRAAGTSAWHTLGSVRPGAQGYFRFGTPTAYRYEYRTFFYATAAVWNGLSRTMRG